LFYSLSAASFEGHGDCVALLLYIGANFQFKNKEGFTARQEAKGDAMDVYQTFDLVCDEKDFFFVTVNLMRRELKNLKNRIRSQIELSLTFWL
jgi:hypothetical protein